MPGIPPIIVAITASAAGLKTGLGEAKADIAAFGDSSKSNLNAAGHIAKLALTGIAVGAIAVGVESLKMAGNFQESVTQLQTGAGESAANLELVSKGMLTMAGAVGQSAKDLSGGMYLVESAGYHGADGLTVLKSAAEGAKLGNADLKTVADGLTTALTDYHLPASDAAKVTSQLVTAVAAGKTTMGELSGSLSSVLPAASKAGIGLDQVLGAMSTMTGQGVSAQQASQNLASTIASLQNPTSVSSKAMAQMGLNSTEVASQLGKKGLTGTMDEMYTAIMNHMGPGGLVLQSSFNQSKLAAQSAQTMLKGLPADLQKIGAGYLAGTVTQKEWAAEMKGQPALISAQGKQFATTAKLANGFSDTLKAGKGDALTFNAALSDMTGGTTGLNTSLALTGGNMATFTGNVATIGGASADAAGNVKDWGEVQKDFNFKLDQAKSSAESLGIKLGTALIPYVEKAMEAIKHSAEWVEKHKTAATNLGIGIGVLATGFVVITAGLKLHAIAQGISAVLSGEATAKTALQAVALGIHATAMGIATVAQWAWNAAVAFATSPITLIVAAIALLVGGIIWVATKTTWFQTIWEYAWGGIQAGASAVWDWLKNNWPMLLAILTGPIGLAVLVISRNWDSITGFFAGARDKIGGFFSGVENVITWPFRTAFNLVSTMWNRTLGGLNVTLPGFLGGANISFPKMPMLASGGTALTGGLAIVGEEGRELVDLPTGARVIPNKQTESLLGGGNNGPLIHIENYNEAHMSPQQIAADLVFRLRTA